MFSNFFHGQMLFHAKSLELYTTAFQSLVSMDEEQDIEVSYLNPHSFEVVKFQLTVRINVQITSKR